MYDAMFWAGNFYWKPSFANAKIACFSWALRQEVMRRGVVHAGFQYFPDPSRYTVIDEFDALRGLLWYRRREIPPSLAFQLCGDTEFERFVLHDAPDPDHQSTDPVSPPPNIRQLRRTGWSTDGAAYEAALRETNVFFAPRPMEGIGMSVLEAMASGHCVVAPNAPTMNEYISHGLNGLLYNLGRNERLDFSDARAIGRRARESIERGHQRWLSSLPELFDFVATPTATMRDSGRVVIPVRNEFAAGRPHGHALVSVVTVCRDAGAVLEATMRSVLSQTGCEFEYVVLDGASTDDSVAIIQRHADRLAAWRSAPDDGPFDAMNAALDLVRGDWVLFMNAGDTFASEDALRRMFAGVPDDADIVYGHHLYELETGAQELRHAAEFETTWSRLRSGDLWFDWLTGIPCHQATAVRRDLLRRLRFDTRYRIAADHDLLFRAKAQGARLFNCDEVISVYTEGGMSGRQFLCCRNEWREIARTHGNADAAEQFHALLAERNAATDRTRRAGHLALRAIAVLDRHAPALARLAERASRTAAVRTVVRRLLRAPAP
jgi:GT2 family glycosyltransferase